MIRFLMHEILLLQLKLVVRERTLSMYEERGEGRRVFVEYEMFFRIFDGPRNVFSCPVFIILFYFLY